MLACGSAAVRRRRGGPKPAAGRRAGATRVYTFYADPSRRDDGVVRDWGDVTRHPGLGLYGAIVVGPEGATYRDPVTGRTERGEPCMASGRHRARS